MHITYLRQPKTISDGLPWLLFDQDSTLTGETLDELAELLHVGERVKEITSRQMSGELLPSYFEDSIYRRLGIIADNPHGKLITEGLIRTFAMHKLTRQPGINELLDSLRPYGFIFGIISGGYDTVSRIVAAQYSMVLCVANSLRFHNGILLPNQVTINVNGNKDKIVEELIRRHRPSHTIYLGDGSNDVPALSMEGVYGIATYDARQVAKKHADYVLPEPNLACAEMKIKEYCRIT
jgi:HAD superfamily phosphoserine phosphatase-like hydrolase